MLLTSQSFYFSRDRQTLNEWWKTQGRKIKLVRNKGRVYIVSDLARMVREGTCQVTSEQAPQKIKGTHTLWISGRKTFQAVVKASAKALRQCVLLSDGRTARRLVWLCRGVSGKCTWTLGLSERVCGMLSWPLCPHVSVPSHLIPHSYQGNC